VDLTPLTLNPIKLETSKAEDADSPSKNALDSFSSILNDTIEKVNTLQKGADTAIEKFVAGELDINDVMVEVEKANAALQLTIQIRNKVIEAYQEVMRMQV
jgi:flagellar hook-basal body complex protein FliE